MWWMASLSGPNWIGHSHSYDLLGMALCQSQDVPDDLEDVLALVHERLIGAVTEKVLQECEQARLVAPQDRLNSRGLFGVGHKYLEHMKGLQLYILAAVAQRIHGPLEILLTRDIAEHGAVVCAVDQQLAEQLE